MSDAGFTENIAPADATVARVSETTLDYNFVYNGTTFDLWRSPAGDAQAATGLGAVVIMGWNGSTYDRVRATTPNDGNVPGNALQTASFAQVWDTVDSDWDRARAISADGVTNDGITAAGLVGYNGTTYDRLRTEAGTTGFLGVGGSVAHDSVDAGNPVKMGGHAYTSTPSPVANGDRVDAWFTVSGALMVSGTNATGADAIANTVGYFPTLSGNSNPLASAPLLFNGTSWDRARSEAGTTGFLGIGGSVAHDGVDAGNPVKMGGKASASAPTNVSAADRVNAWFGLDGALVIAQPGTAAPSDGMTNVMSADTASSGSNASPYPALGYAWNGTTSDRIRTIGALDAAPNVDTGVLAVGTGPGWDRKHDPAGVSATSTASAVTVVVDGARAITFHVVAIGTTPGSMIFEATYDDTNWVTAKDVYKRGDYSAVFTSFVPAVGDDYTVFPNGARQVRYRVNAVYASGTATVKWTAHDAIAPGWNYWGQGGDGAGLVVPATSGALFGGTVGIPGAAMHTFSAANLTFNRAREISSFDSAGQGDTGILAVGEGPGWDRKTNPGGVSATSTASAVTVVTNGADMMAFHVTTIGVTPGSMIFEGTSDDTNWSTAGMVIKLQSGPDVRVEGAFVPAVNDIYLVRTSGYRQVRYRVSAVYASGTATVKVTGVSGVQMVKSIDIGAPPHNFGYAETGFSATFSSAQTSTVIGPTVAAGFRMVLTYVQIQSGGTTAGTDVLYFGTGAFARGTNKPIFDGEFAPSATSKPGFTASKPTGWTGAADEELRLTTTNAQTVTVTIWYYLIAA